MKRGVLPSNSKDIENNGGKKVIKGLLLGDLAKQVKNIDGKMLCKDGNHRNLTVAIMGNLGNDTASSGSFAAMVHGSNRQNIDGKYKVRRKVSINPSATV
ncbi:hypothetical protein Tco_1423737, partial [Tanacetum coccineum]